MAIPFAVFENIIEELAPPACAYEWDNSGTTLRLSDTVSRVLVAVDVTSAAVARAEELGCDCILSHHPLLFFAMKKFSYAAPPASIFLKAVQKGISLYAAHTSCDCAPHGMGEALARKLDVQNTEIFVINDNVPSSGLGVIGEWQTPLCEDEIVQLLKQKLGAKAVESSGVAGSFRRVALASGAGGNLYLEAKQRGAEVLITGEAKYNHYIEAAEANVLLLSAGHFETEAVFVELAAGHIEAQAAKQGLDIKVFRMNGGAGRTVR